MQRGVSGQKAAGAQKAALMPDRSVWCDFIGHQACCSEFTEQLLDAQVYASHCFKRCQYGNANMTLLPQIA